MFRKKPATPAQQMGSSPAGQMRLQAQQAQQAQRDRNQRDFERWCERKLFPAVERYLQMSSRGQRSDFDWKDQTYASVFVNVDHGGRGVRVTSFANYVVLALEARYRAQDYRVDTKVVTEKPDYDYRTGRSHSMRQLDQPMYVTTITW